MFIYGQGSAVDHGIAPQWIPTLQHNELTAALLTEVCSVVRVEPPL